MQGDTEPVDVRRSKAIGILAQPVQALQLLCQHQGDDWDGPTEPANPDQEPAAGDEDETSFEEAEQDTEAADIPGQTAEQDAKHADLPDQAATAGTTDRQQPAPGGDW